MKLLLKGARQVVQVVDDGSKFLRGKEQMRELPVLEAPKRSKEGISVVVDDSGRILDLGPDSDVSSRHQAAHFERVIDVTGKSIIPGLIDGHTHPVWAGDRVHEFTMKLAGATYMEVHEAGGGINFTVDHTRAASEELLERLLLQRLDRMLRAGTTTAECKSGYGLEKVTEMKMLRVLEKAREQTPLEISSTFCGAHSVPRDKTAEEATVDVIEVQLPEVARLNASGQLHVENMDVFCEKGVFDVDQSRRILQAGRDVAKLRINFHADELSPLGGAEMGASLRSEAMSHLEEISEAGISAMAESGSVAVILPTTAYILRLPSPPVRRMIEQNVIVALGTDFNPNAFCLAMPPVMHLACVNQRLSLNEALAAATINAAHSLGRAKTHGSIERGKWADLVVIDAERWEHLIYQLAGHDQLISYVIKKGEVVVEKQQEKKTSSKE